MKTIVKTLSFAACFLIAACTAELSSGEMQENDSSQGGISFTASLEQTGSPASKVQWNEEEDVLLEWSRGDEIAIFDGENVVRSANSAEAGVKASFENVQINVADEYLAWYPYTGELGYIGTKIKGVIPSEQYADKLNVPMFAATSEKTFVFKNACAVLMFTLDMEGVTSITFKGNQNEDLAGEVAVDNSGSQPVISSTGSTSKKITLKNSDGSALSSGKVYYMSVLPQTLESGFTLTFEGDGFSFDKVGNNPAELIRSNRLGLGTISNANYVANVDNNYFDVTGLRGKKLNTITFETLMNATSFDGEEAGINSVFGLEGKWLVRIGDSGYSKNQLQIAGDSSNGGNWPSASKTVSFNTNTWYHLAIVWDSQSGARKIYVNGEEYYSDTNAKGQIDFSDYNQSWNQTHYLRIGYSYSDKRPFHGRFAEMRVWDDIRTPEEIKANMMSLADTDNNNLLAYWKFNEGKGNTVADASGNGNNITSAKTLTWEKMTPELGEAPAKPEPPKPVDTKQVVYIEVNNTNPLNLLEYNLEDGTPFFDAAILFAANINYDSAGDYVYLHNNPNVQALLDETETYIQPLREKGIKVYLGLLGNHTAAGLAQLSDWGAEQWAQEVADAVAYYKLDGVNLDDEYSGSPIIGNDWFTYRSGAAAARLCYELKKAMAEKCDWPTDVSYFYYGSLGQLPTVTIDGTVHHQSEFIDWYCPNYNASAGPYGDLTYANCCAFSKELNRGSGSIDPQKARDYGYGWCMWFAFHPQDGGGLNNNRSYSMNLFNQVAESLYGQSLKQPQYQYYKNGEGSFDPTPHKL